MERYAKAEVRAKKPMRHCYGHARDYKNPLLFAAASSEIFSASSFPR